MSGKTHVVLALIGLIPCLAPVSAQAGMHLLRDIEKSQTSPGPTTEAIDLAAYQHVLHVAAGAAGGDGSRAKPLGAIQAALDAVRDASAKNRYAILVTAGTYPNADVRMKPFVDLFGGYDASFEPNAREIARHATILDAKQAGPLFHGADDARLDGFVLVNGRNAGPGGAIVCEHVSPVISNNVIRDNRTVTPPGFRADMIHQRGSDGGAIAVIAGSSAVVRNNLICNNATDIGGGGGIYVWNECKKPQILNNVICGNRTGVAGRPEKEGSRSSNGGGISVSRDCSPEVAGNVILANSVADNSDGGGIYLEYDAHAHLRGNWIVGNRAQDDGGGMYVMKGSDPVVEYNVFAGNRNTSGGSSAIRLSKEGRMRAANNLFIANLSNSIDAVHSWMILENNTFAAGADHAVIFENQAQHFSPSRIAGNLFLGTQTPVGSKPGPVMPVLVNNLVGGLDESDPSIPGGKGMFEEDGLSGSIQASDYDATSCTTTLRIVGASSPPADLGGRVVKLGERWSVVKGGGPAGTLIVWGDVTGQGDSFTMVRTYRPAKSSPAAAFGAYVARPPQQK